MKKLSNKVAVVTGASKGIGAAIAGHLAAEGAKVVVTYVSGKQDAEKVVAGILAEGGSAIAIQADVAHKEAVEKLFRETVTTFGKLDILVNNAGVYAFAGLDEISSEHFHTIFNINVLGLLLTTQAAIPHFVDAGGSVINISSVVSTRPLGGASVYSASKAAVDAISKALSQELGAKKIRVNSLSPGMVETEGAQTAGIIGSDLHKRVASESSLGRIGQPDDIAKVAAFLASDDAAWVTGEALTASGGQR